jgi:hypothetical protein
MIGFQNEMIVTDLIILLIDTVLLKQKKLPVLDIMGFFPPMSIQVKAEVCSTEAPSPLHFQQLVIYIVVVSFLLVKETGEHGENHRPATSH